MPTPFLALLLALGATGASHAQTPAPTPAPDVEDALVELQLLSELDALHAGDEFLIGLRHELAPHWHIYWKNPGDSGLATRPSLRVPAGFEVGPALFPAPDRIELPGDITVFAYETEVVFFWRVKAPDELGDAQSFEFRAESEWLVCKEECERGAGRAELTLRRAAEDQEVGRDRAAFGASLTRLPQALASLKGASARLSETTEGLALDVRVPLDAELSWFPESEVAVSFVNTVLERTEKLSRLLRQYNLQPSREDPVPRVKGVLVVAHGKRTDYYELDLERPRAAKEETR